MHPFHEIREVKNQTAKEVGKRTKAFENSACEIKEVRHIKTINENMEGQRHSGTDVLYRKSTFKLDGEKVEGVFPRFDSCFDTKLPKALWKAPDSVQFQYCTEKLKQRIEINSEFAKKFTPRQLEQIKSGAPRISGLTWHHNEVPGKMQLVNSDVHEKCRHTGGRSIWGGGSGCR